MAEIVRWCTKYQVCPALNQIFSHFWGRQSLKNTLYLRSCAVFQSRGELLCGAGCGEEVRRKDCWSAEVPGCTLGQWIPNDRDGERVSCLFPFLFHAIQIILQTSSAGPAWTTLVFTIFKGLTIIHGIIGDFLAFSLRTHSVSMFSLSWRKNSHWLRNNQWACQHIITIWRSLLHCRHKKTTSTPSTHQEDALKIFFKKKSPFGKKQRARVLL